MPHKLFSVLGRTTAGRIYFDVANDRMLWDDRSLQIFGARRADFGGTYEDWARFVHEQDRTATQAEVDRCLTEGRELSLRYRIRRRGGEVRHVWTVGLIERDPAGRATAIAGIHMDETEVRRLEAESTLRLQLLAEVVEGICVSGGGTGEIVYANPGLERMFGQPSDSLVRRRVQALFPSLDDTLVNAIGESLTRTGRWLGEVQCRGGDGSAFWASASITPLEHFEYGRLWVWILQDLDVPRVREQTVVHDQDRVETIYDAIADAVFAVRMPARVIDYGNRAVGEMFGYEPDDYIGATTRLFYPNDASYAAFGERLRKAFLAGAHQVRSETELVTSGGRRIYASIITTFETEGGQLSRVISVVRDITQQKELEEQLLHALKMEAIGNLAGGVAHDMNNVLGAVLTMGTVVLDEMPETAPWREDLQRIIDAAERGKSLVEQLLVFASKRPQAVAPLAVDMEIQNVTSLLEHTLPKRIALQVRLGAPDAVVNGDRAQLSQTVLNLCINASDALGGRGTIQVETRVVTLERGALADGLEPGRYVEVAIGDDGPGMPAHVRERAFEPFFSTKAPGKGTGLGLSLAYGVVRNHGGAIRLETQPGVGTTVRCLLPLGMPDAEPDANSEPTPERGDGPKVLLCLVVDDEEMLRVSTKRALERFGHRVLVASGGAEAVEIFESKHREIDVVLLDLAMPEMDGIECSRRLRELEPTVRILMASGRWDERTNTEGVLEGVVRLSKPYSVQQLRKALDELTRR